MEPGYWKFNNTLLGNVQFVTTCNEKIDKIILQTEGLRPTERWEVFKCDISTFCKNYGCALAEEDKLIIAQLSEKVEEMESQLDWYGDEQKAWAVIGGYET